MRDVVIYTKESCPYCIHAKRLLREKGVEFQEISVDRDPAGQADMARKAGRSTVPQIWIGRTHIGGADDLDALERRGELDALLMDPQND